MLTRLNALSNVSLRLTYRNLNRREIGKRVLTALEKVGMAQFYHHKPSELFSDGYSTATRPKSN
ncbi:hypothetical protein [Candidatus Coxiella mudrowiae]|uniref:hypothetical protein n=1 Tax=Candidatus Coxiella mudrowiae TaxID=2054173 RepID=UPI001F1A53A7|nr:hypothetical protein [Candidatus Coxiella mudrowiae]